MATDEYVSSFTGAEIDEAITLAQTALQPSDILNQAGINKNKAISQNAATQLFNQFIYDATTNPNPTAAQNATNVTTNINGKAISTIFESDGITAKNATNATNLVSGGTIAADATATTQDASDNSQRVATTAYVTRAVNAIKNIVSGDISISVAYSSITSNSVKRQGDMVIVDLDFAPNVSTSVTSQVVANIPQGFRPSVESTFSGYRIWNIVVSAQYIYFGFVPADFKISTNGDISVNGVLSTTKKLTLLCGYYI